MNDLNKKGTPSVLVETKPARNSRAIAKPRISSDTLLAGQQELLIEHDGEEYRLRKTSKGRLILTK